VLDRPESSKFTLAESDLLGLFANQAALALDLLLAARRARSVLEEGAGEDAVVARLAAGLFHREGDERAVGLRLLEALTEILGRK